MKGKSEWGWGCNPSVSLFLVMLQETVSGCVAIVAEVELAFVAVPLSVPPLLRSTFVPAIPAPAT